MKLVAVVGKCRDNKQWTRSDPTPENFFFDHARKLWELLGALNHAIGKWVKVGGSRSFLPGHYGLY